jgi:branched-chain amino acid transport system permease protein
METPRVIRSQIMMSVYMQHYLVFVGVFILLVWAFYVPFRAGLLYNGPVYCMAVGGYLAAFLVRDAGWPFGFALIAAIAVGTFFGFAPALGFARTTGVVTSVASMALIFIIQSVIRNLDFLGGPKGLLHIPKIPYLLPLTLILVIGAGVLIYRLDNSRLGRAFEVIGTDPDLARTMGINVRWLSILSLTFSSVLGSLAGVVFAFNLRTIQPEAFGFPLLLSSTAMLFIGGRYTMWGALITVPILWGLPEWVPSELTRYTNLFYGALLIVMLVLRPEGIVTRNTVERIRNLIRKP